MSEKTETCPDCGRTKAHNVGDVLRGGCPKWWAINDAEAEADCRRTSSASVNLSASMLLDAQVTSVAQEELITRAAIAKAEARK